MTEMHFKIPQEFAEGPVGTWRVTVPADEMGGASAYEVGIFTGHIVDIAFHLGEHDTVEFERVVDLTSTKKLPEKASEYVAIQFPISSKTWGNEDIPRVSNYDKSEYLIRMVHEFLAREPSQFSYRVLKHCHYATYALDRRACRDPFTLGTEKFIDERGEPTGKIGELIGRIKKRGAVNGAVLPHQKIWIRSDEFVELEAGVAKLQQERNALGDGLTWILPMVKPAQTNMAADKIHEVRKLLLKYEDDRNEDI